MGEDRDVQAELQDLRKSIDNIDAAMIHILAKRFRCRQRVGALRAGHNLPTADPAREEYQVQRLGALAKGAPEFAEKYLASSSAR